MQPTWIRNNTVGVKNYSGVEVPATSYYNVADENERKVLASDATLLTDITSGDAEIATSNVVGSHIQGVSAQIDYLKAIDPTPRDSDNSAIVRPKVTKTGWHFDPRLIDFVTGKYKSIYNRTSGGAAIEDGVDIGDATLKFYDDQDNELTFQQTPHESEDEAAFQVRLTSDCCKTIMDWQPTYDMEIIGGDLMVRESPTDDTYVWAIVAPDLPAEFGGSVPYGNGGWNLSFFSAKSTVHIDGRGAKMISYDPVYNTNKFRLTVKHKKGWQGGVQIAYNHFKV